MKYFVFVEIASRMVVREFDTENKFKYWAEGYVFGLTEKQARKSLSELRIVRGEAVVASRAKDDSIEVDK